MGELFMSIPTPNFSGSEEDHQYRSIFIHWLLHQSIPTSELRIDNKGFIPKVIIQYWHNLKEIPNDVQECINSWRILSNNGFHHLLFDDENARLFIRKHFTSKHLEAFNLCYHPAMRCDYFRLCYIYRYGGFYVDADEVYKEKGLQTIFSDNKLKIQPLCYDTISNTMIKPEIFLKDTSISKNKIFYVNNNPIIGPAGHELIKLAIERATQLLLQRTNRPEIQSTTGPGNLSASLVKYAIKTKAEGKEWNFDILHNWDDISICRWSLSYRNDERNWRFINNR
jgi:mannosyltransferase OCH1-like enzyme